MSLIITFQLVLFSHFFHRTPGDTWSVTYSPKVLCALKGSTVFMNGSYTHPTNFTVNKAFWLIDPVKGKESSDLSTVSGYSGRVEYLGDKQKHFSLRLSDVKKTDEHEYCIRVLGQKPKDKYLFFPGVILNVTELRVEIPEKAVEGNQTVLACNTTCRLSDTPVFIWYRNDLRIVTIKNRSNNTLILQPTKADDSGSYSCAVKGHEHRSPARNLTVMYPPKKVSVSISPSGEIVEGSSVTLTCSSDANPPVEIYTWFKDMTLIGNGKTYTISKMSVEERGEYKCKCSNEVGHQYSIGVPLDIGASDVSVIVYVSVGVGLFGLTALLLSVLFWLRWKRQKRKTVEAIYQNAGPSDKDDTYAALDPTGRTDDVYHTLTVREKDSY